MVFDFLAVWGAVLGTIGTGIGILRFVIELSRRPRLSHCIDVQRWAGGSHGPPPGMRPHEPYVVITVTKLGRGVTGLGLAGLKLEDTQQLYFNLRSPMDVFELAEGKSVYYFCPKEIVVTHIRKHGIGSYFVDTSEGRKCWRVPKALRLSLR